MNNPLLKHLQTRRSVVVKDMCEPGPNRDQLMQILEAGHRVPDHGKIGPWRFIIFEGEARTTFGEKLKAIFTAQNPEAKEKTSEAEGERFLRAPTIVAVISSPIEHKVPEWEQVLASGAVCMNLLHASHSIGFVAQWLTEWYAYDEKVLSELGLKDGEKVAGYIYIGSAKDAPKERKRPSLEERISFYP